jgi:hypothetical protein
VAEPQRINPRWVGEPCIIAAPGPSLTPEIVRTVRLARWISKWRVIVVNDAWKMHPAADVLYAADNGWWNVHGKCEGFQGEKWACHEQEPNAGGTHGNDKRLIADQFGINLVRGRDGDEFSCDPEFVRYGSNSGFQAINLALLFGSTRIVLVGFDMRHVAGRAHFFGDHPAPLSQRRDGEYERFCIHYDRAAKKLPGHVSIVNATADSALKCFPMMSLDDALKPPVSGAHRSVHCDGAESYTAAG